MSSSETITVRVMTEESRRSNSDGAPDVLRGDEAEQEAFWNRGRPSTEDIEVKVDELSRSLSGISSKLERAIETDRSADHQGGFSVDSFKVGLAVSGSGKVVLVGEIGVEASIEVTFKRND